jgi:hypothetical protein
VRINAIAFAAGILLGAAANHSPRSQDDVDAIELRFVVELTERANDRLLSDIRAFNAVAYGLLGPLFALVAFVDYADRWNALTLAFTALGLVFTFLTLLSGDGAPTPTIADRSFFDMFSKTRTSHDGTSSRTSSSGGRTTGTTASGSARG